MVVRPKSLEIIKKNKESLDNNLSTRTSPTKQLHRHANKITCKYVVITKEICVILFTTKANHIALIEEDKSCYG